MAFGDNYNDVSMLDIVGVPYIMDGAAAPLREKYPNHTPRPEDVLREFLKQNWILNACVQKSKWYDIRKYFGMTKVLFICHGNIFEKTK